MGKGTAALLLGLIAIIAVSFYVLLGSFIDERGQAATKETDTAVENTEALHTPPPAAGPERQNKTDKNASSLFQTHTDPAATPNKIGDRIFIFGRVGDSDNSPLADVTVATVQGFQKTTTDHNGHYRFAVQIPREEYVGLTFLRSGYEAERISIVKSQMKSTDEIEVNTNLDAALDTVLVKGIVRNEQGQPIENEQVKLFSRQLNLYYFAFTDAYGEFSFDGVKIDHRYALEAGPTTSYKQFKKNRLNIDHNPPYLEIVLRTVHYGGLSGNIVDSEGTPLADFPMQILSSAIAGEEYSIVSDESGFFELGEVPSGDLKFVHRANPHFKITGIVLEPAARSHVRVRLDVGAHSVEGWVNDNYGVPVTAARVILTGSHVSGQIESKSNRWLNADANGFFRFDRVGEGIHDITVTAKGYLKSKLELPVGRYGVPIQIALSPDPDGQ